MAHAGLTRFDRTTASRIVFRQTRADTNGMLLQFDTYRQPSHLDCVLHMHPGQEETIRVISGAIDFSSPGLTLPLTAGNEIIVPPGKVHAWHSIGADDLHVVTELRPALHFEDLLETTTVARLTGKKKTSEYEDSNAVRWLQLMAALSLFPGEYSTPGVPLPLQRQLLRAFGPMIRRVLRS
jgi:mannose-6-phosphate isomerase-like protein (cupin superfamily)